MTLKEIDQNVNASNIDDKIIGLRLYIKHYNLTLIKIDWNYVNVY